MKSFEYTLIVAIMLGLFCSPELTHAKRVAPPRVAPVTHDGVVYSALHANHGNSGFGKTAFVALVKAIDTKTNKLVWQTQVYEIAYKPGLETDVQDVWIKSLSVKGSQLFVVNEDGNKFSMDLKSGKLVVSTGPVNGLNVQLMNPRKTAFGVGEQIKLKSVFENVGKGEFSMTFWWIRSLHITDAKGRVVQSGPGKVLPTGRAEGPRVIKPGNKVQKDEYMSCTQPSGAKQKVGWSYQLKPGTYRVALVIESPRPHGLTSNTRADAWKGRVVSNEVTVVVK